eukprot:g1723.t1
MGNSSSSPQKDGLCCRSKSTNISDIPDSLKDPSQIRNHQNVIQQIEKQRLMASSKTTSHRTLQSFETNVVTLPKTSPNEKHPDIGLVLKGMKLRRLDSGKNFFYVVVLGCLNTYTNRETFVTNPKQFLSSRTLKTYKECRSRSSVVWENPNLVYHMTKVKDDLSNNNDHVQWAKERLNAQEILSDSEKLAFMLRKENEDWESALTLVAPSKFYMNRWINGIKSILEDHSKVDPQTISKSVRNAARESRLRKRDSRLSGSPDAPPGSIEIKEEPIPVRAMSDKKETSPKESISVQRKASTTFKKRQKKKRESHFQTLHRKMQDDLKYNLKDKTRDDKKKIQWPNAKRLLSSEDKLWYYKRKVEILHEEEKKKDNDLKNALQNLAKSDTQIRRLQQSLRDMEWKQEDLQNKIRETAPKLSI